MLDLVLRLELKVTDIEVDYVAGVLVEGKEQESEKGHRDNQQVRLVILFPNVDLDVDTWQEINQKNDSP